MYAFKGEYDSGAAYSPGDVVIFTDHMVYWLQKAAAAGTPCHDTMYWQRMEKGISEAVLMMNNAVSIAIEHALDNRVANGLTTTASGKVLDARQGKALKTLIDGVSGTVSGALPDAKTLRLASSTASSTKVFDITVDDDGELTATEYTPPEAT